MTSKKRPARPSATEPPALELNAGNASNASVSGSANVQDRDDADPWGHQMSIYDYLPTTHGRA
ncbi:hypothetical protein SAMN05216246_1129 [Actinomyces denticolens]|uniref:Uncharacterized protein n=1 Tax=Actinomyces denticolens TaxID=52767 RepID=A0ABY1IG70_9ACTO|nr:hypothetical protein [Actinomyces denticolens]SHJ12910.1 hypothetical protein SAMN05216246_1129 [Actinomyces denticolens]